MDEEHTFRLDGSSSTRASALDFLAPALTVGAPSLPGKCVRLALARRPARPLVALTEDWPTLAQRRAEPDGALEGALEGEYAALSASDLPPLDQVANVAARWEDPQT